MNSHKEENLADMLTHAGDEDMCRQNTILHNYKDQHLVFHLVPK